MRSPGAPDAQPETPMKKIISVIMAGQMIFFAFYTGAYSMTSILKEEEEGTLARLFTTPTDRHEHSGWQIPGGIVDGDRANAGALDSRAPGFRRRMGCAA